MAYGTVKVDNVTFTYNAVDATTTFSGFYASTTNNLTLSGTASAATFTGTTANFTNVNAQNISVTTALSGLSITGGTAGFTTVTGTTVTGTTASFTSGVFTSLSGTTHTITSGVFASGTAALPSISFVSDPNTGVFSPGADQLAVATNGSERARIDSSGKLLVGTNAAIDASSAPLQVAQTDGPAITLWHGSATATGNNLTFHKTRATTVGAYSILSSGDRVGRLDFFGDDGTDIQSIAARIDVAIDGTPALNDMPGRIVLSTTAAGAATPTERLRIDSSGRLLVGTATSRSAGNERIILSETTSNSAGITLVRNTNDTGGPAIGFAKSRGTSVGSNTIVQNDDLLGALFFLGADGADIDTTAASIRGEVDGTPGSNDMPGRLVFSTTADGASSPTERMRIDSLGVLIKYGNSTTARIIPQTDNAGYIGQDTKRWQAIYAVNGTIQTSDVREKTDIVDSPLGADFIRSLRPVAYKWKIGGYTSTYDDEGKETITPNPGVRTHYGFIAQEVKQATGNTDFGGWLQEDLNDPDSKQSLRLHEFISPIVKALQEALEEIDKLKAEVAALKAQ